MPIELPYRATALPANVPISQGGAGAISAPFPSPDEKPRPTVGHDESTRLIYELAERIAMLEAAVAELVRVHS